MVRIISYVLVVVMTCSCNKIFDVACPTTDENRGLIIQNYVTTDADCLVNTFTLEGLNEGVVIQNEQEFGAIIPNLDQFHGPCDVSGLDLEKHTLLGLLTQGTGCTISYRRSVTGKGSQYVFEITMRECGGCEPIHISPHWVTIPKIPEDVKVSFKVNTQKFNE